MLLKKTTQSNSRLQLTLDHENMLRNTSEKLVVSKALGPEALPMDTPERLDDNDVRYLEVEVFCEKSLQCHNLQNGIPPGTAKRKGKVW